MELADRLTAEHKLNLGMKPEPGGTETDCRLSVSLTDPQVDKDDRSADRHTANIMKLLRPRRQIHS